MNKEFLLFDYRDVRSKRANKAELLVDSLVALFFDYHFGARRTQRKFYIAAVYISKELDLDMFDRAPLEDWHCHDKRFGEVGVDNLAEIVCATAIVLS